MGGDFAFCIRAVMDGEVIIGLPRHFCSKVHVDGDVTIGLPGSSCWATALLLDCPGQNPSGFGPNSPRASDSLNSSSSLPRKRGPSTAVLRPDCMSKK